MQLEFQCQKCEESFSVEVNELGSDPELRCPGCGAKTSEEQLESLSDALDQVFATLAQLRRKFHVTFEVDTEDLPAPYDEAPAAAAKAPLLEEEESEDEDEELLEEEEGDLDEA